MHQNKFQVRELTEELKDKISEAIKPYVIFMVGINDQGKNESLDLLGSGTLVKYRNFYGILTANHVIQARNFKEAQRIGFSIIEGPIKFEIENYSLVTHPIGEYGHKIGPDLALIELPSIKLYQFKEHKAFLNLEKASLEDIINNYNNNGVWIISGCANESAIRLGGNRNFHEIIAFTYTFWFGGFDRVWEKDGFDYIEAKAIYDEENEPPNSFRGVSGGGLWQVPLNRVESGDLEIVNFILAGVAFYQTEIVDDYRFVRCHGKMSIYSKLKNFLHQLTH